MRQYVFLYGERKKRTRKASSFFCSPHGLFFAICSVFFLPFLNACSLFSSSEEEKPSNGASFVAQEAEKRIREHKEIICLMNSNASSTTSSTPDSADAATLKSRQKRIEEEKSRIALEKELIQRLSEKMEYPIRILFVEKDAIPGLLRNGMADFALIRLNDPNEILAFYMEYIPVNSLSDDKTEATPENETEHRQDSYFFLFRRRDPFMRSLLEK